MTDQNRRSILRPYNADSVRVRFRAKQVAGGAAMWSLVEQFQSLHGPP